MEITDSSTKKEIIYWLALCERNELLAVAVYLRNNMEYDIPVYSTKDQLLNELKHIEREDLFEAIDALFPDEEPSEDGAPEDDEDEELTPVDEENDDDTEPLVFLSKKQNASKKRK